MKYKIDNKYIVEADSFRDAVKAVKRLKKAKLGDRATEADIAKIMKYMKSEYVIRPVDDQAFFYIHPYDHSDTAFVHLENGKIVFEQQGKKVAEFNSAYEYEHYADSVNDAAQQVYTIHWIDTYAKSKGYDRSLCSHTTEIKANDVAEALNKLSGKVVLDFGVGTANCLVVSVSTPKTTYQWSGRLSELVKKSKEDLGDSVHDSPASDVFREIKSKYPTVHFINVGYTNIHGAVLFNFEVIDYPKEKKEALRRFIQYVMTSKGYNIAYKVFEDTSKGSLGVLASMHDSVNDVDKDFIIVQLVMGNRYKVAEWPAESAEAALKEFKEANPRWSGRQLQAIPKNEWKGTYADAEDTYWKVRYGHEDDEIQYTSVLIVKGSSEQDVIRKFKSRKPGYKIFSVTEGVPEGVESMRRRGMSVWDD